MPRRVVVVGSGPAGLWAARYACENGAEVTVLEARRKVGSKLLISGAGKCNYTNILSARDQAERFGRARRFILKAMNFLPPEKLVWRLGQLGVVPELVDDFYYFPASSCAADIMNAVMMPQIEYCTSAAVTGIKITGDRVCAVKTLNEEEIPADAVVLACGGLSYPQLGGDMSLVYRAAKLAGHNIVPPVPGLVGLKIADYSLSELSGMVLEDAELIWYFGGKKMRTGGILLFTHNGISGPAVLDISAAVARALSAGKAVKVKIKFFKELDAGSWDRILLTGSVDKGKKSVASCLAERLTRRCAELLLMLAGIPSDRTMSRLTAPERRLLTGLLGGMEKTVCDTEGWRKAMVTSGGVELKEVNPETLESRLVKGLFFAGEQLDVDGPCGGYNIQWASASGALAGFCAATSE